MDAAHGKRIVVLAGSPEDSGPLVADLRGGGHEVRVASDWRVAHHLLAGGKADFILSDADSISRHTPSGNVEDADLKAAVIGVAHELSGLLNALAETADELRQLTSDAAYPGHAEALGRLRRRILWTQDSLADLLAATLDWTAQELRLAEASLEDLVERAAITVCTEALRKDQRLVVNVDEEASRVRADPQKLRRVLSILLGNAVRHAPVAGTVTVEARREGSDCLITVSDSGEGIASDDSPHPFALPETAGTKQPAGRTSVHAGVVQRLVNQHGGRVWVEGRPDRGRVVSVALPQPGRPAGDRTRRADPPRGGQEDRG